MEETEGSVAASHASLEHIVQSPLWMVTKEPALNEFVSGLQNTRRRLLEHPELHHELTFSRAKLVDVRAAFAAMIRKGEERLHELAQILSENFFTKFQSESVVIGEVLSLKQRFTISQTISAAELHSITDIDLGNRQLKKLRYFDGKNWVEPVLVANMVEYQPTEPNDYQIHKLISRIKAEEEIWNKVVDELFDLDSLVRRDKQLMHLSRYVKDIFGLKIVVGSIADAQALQHTLENFAGTKLEFFEVKDYLGIEERKQTGWEAIKSVVLWKEKTFEIQIQPLSNYLYERERLTRESHAGFKAQRELVRNQVAAAVPLFRFYRDLLQWLFSPAQDPAPTYPGMSVKLME